MTTPIKQNSPDEGDRHSTPEYRSWSSMRNRCNNPNATGYARYGGRGIKVCRQWDSFDTFLADVGKRPAKGYTLHRKENDGHYDPGNVVWADWITQNNSRRGNHVMTVRGEQMTVANAGRRFGINYLVIHNRLQSGWPEEQAATLPLLANGSARKYCIWTKRK